MIVTDNISYNYNKSSDTLALNNISISIDNEKFVIISGPSGSGKTTLLYVLGGLIAVEQGDVSVDSISITKMNKTDLARYRNETIGFIFQNFFLDESLSNLENVYLPALIMGKKSKKEYESKALDLLAKVGLTEEQIKRKPNQLSGGEQQRVAIARALINSPKIILADEPTGNLDSKKGQAIMQLLKELSNQGILVILVTHDQSYFHLADKIISIQDGKVV